MQQTLSILFVFSPDVFFTSSVVCLVVLQTCVLCPVVYHPASSNSSYVRLSFGLKRVTRHRVPAGIHTLNTQYLVADLNRSSQYGETTTAF